MSDEHDGSDTAKKGSTANDVACWDCAEHATERLEEMFVDLIQRNRIERGQTPARRTVFLKQHGMAYGCFKPLSDLPEDMKVGTFAHGQLPCWIRFSSDTQPTAPDLHSTLGIGLKLFGVPGPKLLGESDTADFIMQNHDVFFVDNAQEFCEFTTAGAIDHDYPGYLERHPATVKILDDMKKPETSCLTASYWAILPFAFGKDASGEDRFVKYRLKPVNQPPGTPFDDRNYLAIDLASRLRLHDAHFQFEVQFRTKPDSMPLDEATVPWDSPWTPVADLILPRQDIERRGQSEYGDTLAFNIWRTPPEQEPQGSIAAARKVVYKGSADQRRLANGAQLTEPDQPRPQTDEQPQAEVDDCIVRAAIYPPIGICRVGNSPDAFYIGPEVADPPDLPDLPPGWYRDSAGRLKREAARFRIYGLNGLGRPVKELTAENAAIYWSVQVANQKASWYEFQLALDIPEIADAPPSLLRNATVEDRAALTISPNARQISGKEKSGAEYAFDDGTFMGEPVYLGELQTDKAGRLIVLGGHGVSASHSGSRAVTFANNDGWHDDVSDGPVTATAVYEGVELAVDPAWVVCAPPNYGPQQKSVRTMWDLMRDVAIQNGMLARPERPSFQNDIRPIFERLSQLQWTNKGFSGGFGFNRPFDFRSQDWLSQLSDPTPANLEIRRVLYNNFRHVAVDSWSPVPWPWLYGDAMDVPAAHTPRQNASLSGFQLWALKQWAIGDFDADYVPDPDRPREIEDVPVAEQPDMLTRAAMEFCVADAFHPGCEMTWPMRQPGMYKSAFRLKHRSGHSPRPPFGAKLNSDDWTLPDGPIRGGQSPGSITRWMAIPWQTDTASCRSGYDKTYDPYLPSFWPARVPNQVMSDEAYNTVMDTERPLGERLQAFANRSNWFEPLGLDQNYTHQINQMIKHFDRMGVLEVRLGPKDDPDFPPVMQVSDQPDLDDKDKADAKDRIARPLSLDRDDADTGDPDADGAFDLSQIEKVRRFPGGLRRPRTT